MAKKKNPPAELSNDKIWDLFDKAHPELRADAKAAAVESTKELGRALHSEDEIWDYISHDYPELANAKQWAVGWTGGNYRVAVIDQSNVNHTLKINPKEIDAHQAMKARAASVLEQIKSEPPHPLKENKHDRDR